MKKLNKSQIWDLIQGTTETAVEANTELFKKGKEVEFTESLLAALADIFKPKAGGGTSTKVNAEGEVYCNYFEKYLPSTDFKTKLSKPDADGERREVYKANSIQAEKILRKLKTVRGTTESMAMEYFRANKINEEQFNKLLDTMETVLETKYSFEADVPTVVHIFQEAGIEL